MTLEGLFFDVFCRTTKGFGSASNIQKQGRNTRAGERSPAMIQGADGLDRHPVDRSIKPEPSSSYRKTSGVRLIDGPELNQGSIDALSITLDHTSLLDRPFSNATLIPHKLRRKVPGQIDRPSVLARQLPARSRPVRGYNSGIDFGPTQSLLLTRYISVHPFCSSVASRESRTGRALDGGGDWTQPQTSVGNACRRTLLTS